MNIKEAKQQIKNAIIAYSTTNAFNKPIVPVSKQRPIFLLGAPGIGKTAIMEQIASELDIALVSYSMTHHTRQSALGLPFIVDKTYDSKDYKITEYTMSEIIASVYDEMEKTGKDKGILFLDEINCISETLAPSMLQFLQYKTFGRHRVPEGWIVVTAGNPAEYNNSVREYDIAIWDRLKKIEVEADYETWKEFAINTHVHPVVTSYLDIKPQNFYSITTTVDGKNFVTARGWDDLSTMIQLYEMNDIEVDSHLIDQYLQDDDIARDFSHYYQLFHKYQADYQIDTILNGNASSEIKERATKAKFDERLSLISLLVSGLDDMISTANQKENAFKKVLGDFKAIQDNDYATKLPLCIQKYRDEEHQLEVSNNLSVHRQEELRACVALLEKLSDNTDQLKAIMKEALVEVKDHQAKCDIALNAVFTFFEDIFGSGQELLILVTECTINQAISSYIFAHGCDKYYQHNDQLLFKDQNKALVDRINAFNLLEIEKELG